MKDVTECYHCGLFLEKNSKKIICPRCANRIKVENDHSIDSLYYAITGLLLFVFLNIFPMITLYSNGNVLNTTLFNCFLELFKEGFVFVSILIFFTIILAPLLNFLIIILAFINNKKTKKLFSYKFLHNSFHFFKDWSFLEVFIISIVVSYIKLVGLVSNTKFDIGFYIMIFYFLIFYMANKKFDIKKILE